jgi:hypothetical protein
MPAGAFQVYRPAIGAIGGATLDLDASGTPKFRMTLVTSAYTPNIATHNDWQDVSANEVAAGGGYTTHGKLLTVTWTAPGSPGLWTFDCDDQSWTSSTITAKYAVIVSDADANGVLAATDQLLCYVDLETGGGSVSTTNGTFAVNINAAGVFTLEQTN